MEPPFSVVAMREHIGDDPLSGDVLVSNWTTRGGRKWDRFLDTYGYIVFALQSPHTVMQFQEQLEAVSAIFQHSQRKCQRVDHN